MKKPRICAKEGCGERATQMVLALLRPPRKFGDGEIHAFLDLVLCEDCAARASVKSVISDEGWSKLSAGVVAIGKVAPERGRTAVRCVPIDQAPDMFRERYEPG